MRYGIDGDSRKRVPAFRILKAHIVTLGIADLILAFGGLFMVVILSKHNTYSSNISFNSRYKVL